MPRWPQIADRRRRHTVFEPPFFSDLRNTPSAQVGSAIATRSLGARVYGLLGGANTREEFEFKDARKPVRRNGRCSDETLKRTFVPDSVVAALDPKRKFAVAGWSSLCDSRADDRPVVPAQPDLDEVAGVAAAGRGSADEEAKFTSGSGCQTVRLTR